MICCSLAVKVDLFDVFNLREYKIFGLVITFFVTSLWSYFCTAGYICNSKTYRIARCMTLCLTLCSVLWKKMYERYLRKTKAGKNLGIPLDTPTMWWKKQCVERWIHLIIIHVHVVYAGLNCLGILSH